MNRNDTAPWFDLSKYGLRLFKSKGVLYAAGATDTAENQRLLAETGLRETTSRFSGSSGPVWALRYGGAGETDMRSLANLIKDTFPEGEVVKLPRHVISPMDYRRPAQSQQTEVTQHAERQQQPTATPDGAPESGPVGLRQQAGGGDTGGRPVSVRQDGEHGPGSTGPATQVGQDGPHDDADQHGQDGGVEQAGSGGVREADHGDRRAVSGAGIPATGPVEDAEPSAGGRESGAVAQSGPTIRSGDSDRPAGAGAGAGLTEAQRAYLSEYMRVRMEQLDWAENVIPELSGETEELNARWRTAVDGGSYVTGEDDPMHLLTSRSFLSQSASQITSREVMQGIADEVGTHAAAADDAWQLYQVALNNTEVPFENPGAGFYLDSALEMADPELYVQYQRRQNHVYELSHEVRQYLEEDADRLEAADDELLTDRQKAYLTQYMNVRMEQMQWAESIVPELSGSTQELNDRWRTAIDGTEYVTGDHDPMHLLGTRNFLSQSASQITSREVMQTIAQETGTQAAAVDEAWTLYQIAIHNTEERHENPGAGFYLDSVLEMADPELFEQYQQMEQHIEGVAYEVQQYLNEDADRLTDQADQEQALRQQIIEEFADTWSQRLEAARDLLGEPDGIEEAQELLAPVPPNTDNPMYLLTHPDFVEAPVEFFETRADFGRIARGLNISEHAENMAWELYSETLFTVQEQADYEDGNCWQVVDQMLQDGMGEERHNQLLALEREVREGIRAAQESLEQGEQSPADDAEAPAEEEAPAVAPEQAAPAAGAAAWVPEAYSAEVAQYIQTQLDTARASIEALSGGETSGQLLQDIGQQLERGRIGAEGTATQLLGSREFEQISVTEIETLEQVLALGEQVGVSQEAATHAWNLIEPAIGQMPPLSELEMMIGDERTGQDVFETLQRAVNNDQYEAAVAAQTQATFQLNAAAAALAAGEAPTITETPAPAPEAEQAPEDAPEAEAPADPAVEAETPTEEEPAPAPEEPEAPAELTADEREQRAAELLEQYAEQLDELKQSGTVPEDTVMAVNVRFDGEANWEARGSVEGKMLFGISRPNFEDAIESLSAVANAQQQSLARHAERERYEAEAAESIRTGIPLNDEQLKQLFELDPGSDSVKQANVGWFLTKHLGVNGNQIRSSLGDAASTVTVDGRETAMANPRMLPGVFGAAFMESELATVRQSVALPDDVHVERGSQGEWHLTYGEGDSVIRTQANALLDAASQMADQVADLEEVADQDEGLTEDEAEAPTLETPEVEDASEEAPAEAEATQEDAQTKIIPYFVNQDGALTTDAIGNFAQQAWNAQTNFGWEKGKDYPFVVRQPGGRDIQLAVRSNDTQANGSRLNVWGVGQKSVLHQQPPSLVVLNWTVQRNGQIDVEHFDPLILNREKAEKVNADLKEMGYAGFTDEMISEPSQFLAGDWYNSISAELMPYDEFVANLDRPDFIAGPDPEAPTQGGLFAPPEKPDTTSEDLQANNEQQAAPEQQDTLVPLDDLLEMPHIGSPQLHAQFIAELEEVGARVEAALDENGLLEPMDLLARAQSLPDIQQDVRTYLHRGQIAKTLLTDLEEGSNRRFDHAYSEQLPKTAAMFSDIIAERAEHLGDLADAQIAAQMLEGEFLQRLSREGNTPEQLFAAVRWYEAEGGDTDETESMLLSSAWASALSSSREWESEDQQRDYHSAAYREARFLLAEAGFEAVLRHNGEQLGLEDDVVELPHDGFWVRHPESENPNNWVMFEPAVAGIKPSASEMRSKMYEAEGDQFTLVSQTAYPLTPDNPIQGPLVAWFSQDAGIRAALIEAHGGEALAHEDIMEGYVGRLGDNQEGRPVSIDSNGLRFIQDEQGTNYQNVTLFNGEELAATTERPDWVGSPFETRAEIEARAILIRRADVTADLFTGETLEAEQEDEAPEAAPAEEDDLHFTDEALQRRGGEYVVPMATTEDAPTRRPIGELLVAGNEELIASEVVVAPVRLNRREQEQLNMQGQQQVHAWRVSVIERDEERYNVVEAETEITLNRGDDFLSTGFTRLYRGLDMLDTKVPQIREAIEALNTKVNQELLEAEILEQQQASLAEEAMASPEPEILARANDRIRFLAEIEEYSIPGQEGQLNIIPINDRGYALRDTPWEQMGVEDRVIILQHCRELQAKLDNYHEVIRQNRELDEGQKGHALGDAVMAWETTQADWAKQQVLNSEDAETYLADERLFGMRAGQFRNKWTDEVMERAKTGPLSIAALDDILEREGPNGLGRFHNQYAPGIEGYKTPELRRAELHEASGIGITMRDMKITSELDDLNGRTLSIPADWDGRIHVQQGEQGNWEVHTLLANGTMTMAAEFEDGERGETLARAVRDSLANERWLEVYPEAFEAGKQLMNARNTMMGQAGDADAARFALATDVFGLDRRSQMLADHFSIDRSVAIGIAGDMNDYQPKILEQAELDAVLDQYPGLRQAATAMLERSQVESPEEEISEQEDNAEQPDEDTELEQEPVDQPEVLDAGADDAPTEESVEEPEQPELDAGGEEETGRVELAEALEIIGLEIDRDQLEVFGGMTQAQAAALADVEVRLTTEPAFEGHPSAQELAGNTSLVMNAARPLLGSEEIQGEFLKGRFYVQVDMSQPEADGYIQRNIDLDAALPIQLNEDTIAALAYTNMSERLQDRYLDEHVGGGPVDVKEALLDRRNDYTLGSFVESVNQLRSSLGMEPLAIAEQVQATLDAELGTDEVEQPEEDVVLDHEQESVEQPEELDAGADDAPTEEPVEEPGQPELDAGGEEEAPQPEEAPAVELEDVMRGLRFAYGQGVPVEDQVAHTVAVAQKLITQENVMGQIAANTPETVMVGGALPGQVNQILLESITDGDPHQIEMTTAIMRSDQSLDRFNRTMIDILSHTELLEQLEQSLEPGMDGDYGLEGTDQDEPGEQTGTGPRLGGGGGGGGGGPSGPQEPDSPETSLEQDTQEPEQAPEPEEQAPAGPARVWAGATRDHVLEVSGWSASPLSNQIEALKYLEAEGIPQEDEDPSWMRALQFNMGWGAENYNNEYPLRMAANELGWSLDELKTYITLNKNESYFTQQSQVDAMWAALEKAGVPHNSNILEPAVGAGAFLAGAPAEYQANANFVGVDRDEIAARFAKALAPDANIINASLESTLLQDNFGGVVGNVPFGQARVHCPKHGDKPYVHDYFMRRSLEALEPGGVAALVVSRGFLDRENENIRKQIMEHSDLIGGVRAPDNLFSEAGASVVTDILVFQKRPEGVEPSYDWSGTTTLTGEDPDTGEAISMRVNNFFADNPQFILGDLAIKSTPYGEQATITERELSRDQLNTRIAEALVEQVPQGIYQETRSKVASSQQEQQEEVDKASWSENARPAADDHQGVIIGQYVLDNDQLAEVTGFETQFDSDGTASGESVMVSPIELSRRSFRRDERIIRDYIPLRDAALELRQAQMGGSDEVLTAAQDKARELYEAFVEAHGPVNGTVIAGVVGDDPTSAEVFSLERYDFTNHEVLGQADTLNKRVIGNETMDVKVETAEDAYWASLDRRGDVNIEFMSEISGIEQDKIIADLLNEHIYHNPLTNEYEPAFEYLSGNIVEKLDFAKQAAATDPAYHANIEALEEVRPAQRAYEDIHANLGASWIPGEMIRDWVRSMTIGMDSEKDFDVSYSVATGDWTVTASGPFRSRNETLFNSELGHPKRAFPKLLENALNGATPYFTVKDDEGKSVADTQANNEVADVLKNIRESFKTWMNGSEEVMRKVEDIYNNEVNVFARSKPSGVQVTFPGMADGWKPMPHQNDFVARMLRGYNVGSAHPVGAGKTFEMVAGAMKMKQLGGAGAKPMLVVPNHMLAQVTNEGKGMFPGAKILAMTNDDLSEANKERFLAVTRNNDWDMVVVTHSVMDKMRAPNHIRLQTIDEQMDVCMEQIANEENGNARRKLADNLKTLQSRREKLESDMEAEKRGEVSSRNRTHQIEDLGITHLLVDEAHLYKNLFLNTSLSVAGLNTGAGSNRANNLMELTNYFREQNEGQSKGVFFFTATPVSNSVAEIWSMMKFLRPELLEMTHSQHFDSWAMNYAKIETKPEILAEGNQVGLRTRMTGFDGSIRPVFHECYDVKLAEELKLPTPDYEQVLVQVDPTPLQEAFQEHLAIRATAIRDGDVDRDTDNLLTVSQQGRFGAIDLQLIDSRIPDEQAGNKLAVAAENIHKIWSETHDKKGAQLVFLDVGVWKSDSEPGLYGKLKDMLVEKGVNPDEVRFIHEAGTGEKAKERTEAILSDVRSGKTRVLIGSTGKMGVGTNAQERLAAQHHLDIGWKPSDYEQRKGRIVRQGNKHFDKVTIFDYVTHNSSEAGLGQKNKTKYEWVSQALRNDDYDANLSIDEDYDPTYAEMMAAATGEPKIAEHAEVTAEYEEIVRAQTSWQRQQTYVRTKERELTGDIARTERAIELAKEVHQSLPQASMKGVVVKGEVTGLDEKTGRPVTMQDGDTTWIVSNREPGRGLDKDDPRQRISMPQVLKRVVENQMNRAMRFGGRDDIDLGISVGKVNFAIQQSNIIRGMSHIIGTVDDAEVRDLRRELDSGMLKTGVALTNHIRKAWEAAGWVEGHENELSRLKEAKSMLPEPQTEWPRLGELQEITERKAELDEWAKENDFAERYRNIPDRFASYINNLDATNGAELSEDEELGADEVENVLVQDAYTENNGSGLEESGATLNDIDMTEDVDQEQEETTAPGPTRPNPTGPGMG